MSLEQWSDEQLRHHVRGGVCPECKSGDLIRYHVPPFGTPRLICIRNGCNGLLKMFWKEPPKPPPVDTPLSLLRELIDCFDLAGELPDSFIGRVRQILHSNGVKTEIDLHDEESAMGVEP